MKAGEFFEEAMIQEKKRQEKEEERYQKSKAKEEKNSFVMWKNLKTVACERQFKQRKLGFIWLPSLPH